MGGFKSGNRSARVSKKGVVEDCLSLDSVLLAREGILWADVHRTYSLTGTYPNGSDFLIHCEVCTTDETRPWVRLRYSWVSSAARQTESADYPVELATTAPQFGMPRWWFLCPLSVGEGLCGQRVRKLYLPPTGGCFGCRQCHDLTYTSCQESRKDAWGLVPAARGRGRGAGTAAPLFDPIAKRHASLRKRIEKASRNGCRRANGA